MLSVHAGTVPHENISFAGPVVLCGGYDRDSAEAELTARRADLVAFGRPYLANPDLVARFKANAELNTPDQETFYGGDEHGYTDYPFMNS